MIIIISVAGVVFVELLVETILTAVFIARLIDGLSKARLCLPTSSELLTFFGEVSITQGITTVLIEITWKDMKLGSTP